LESTQKSKTTGFSTVLITIIIIVSLMAGGLVGYSISNSTTSAKIDDLQNQLSTLQEEILNLNSTQNITNENNTYYLGNNVSLPQLYEQVKDSVVVVQGVIVLYDFFGRPYAYSEVQGSGFVSNLTGQFVVITNYHVVQDAINITVTFTDGDTYAANVTGSDPYADLAVLSANAPQYEYKPLSIISSSTLKVGDSVIAVGTPLGLTGSMTSGIVSALGRTVSVSWSSYAIADCIQTTAPINPGNSGGPLLNYQGEVVGITSYTAITSQGVAAQGLGLAIPSSTILRETEALITNGSYNSHPVLGISGTDMTFEIAQSMNTNVTYGVLIAQVTSGGPANKAGLQKDDIVIEINATSIAARIRGMDDLSTFLEEYTSPNQTVNVTIVRNNQTKTFLVELGTRPPPT
jgi:S1-C subfamily serine protease